LTGGYGKALPDFSPCDSAPGWMAVIFEEEAQVPGALS